MKRKLTTAVAAILILSMLMAGCGKKAEEPDGSSTEEEKQAVTVVLNTDANQHVVLPDYDSADLAFVSNKEITEADIDERINMYLMESAVYQIVEDRTTVEKGDVVTISYKSTKDGKTLEENDAFVVDTGEEDSALLGISEALIGRSSESPFDAELTYGDDYYDDGLIGKTADFEISIEEIGAYSYPELTDDFIEDLELEDENGNVVEGIDQFREYIRKELESMNDEDSEYAVQSKILEYLMENSEVKEIPEEYIESLLTVFYGMEKDSDEYDEYYEYAREDAKQLLILQAIAEKENITVSHEEVEDLLSEYGIDAQQLDESDLKVYELTLQTDKVLETLTQRFMERRKD